MTKQSLTRRAMLAAGAAAGAAVPARAAAPVDSVTDIRGGVRLSRAGLTIDILFIVSGLGLDNKRNSLAAVSATHGPELLVTTGDIGTLLVWSERVPGRVLVDGVAAPFTYDGQLVRVPLTGAPRACQVTVA